MSTFRSATTTLAPSLAKSRACAAPRPLAAPVTSATFPAILLLILCLLNSLSAQFRPASLRVLFSDRSEERRVGKECVCSCRYRWSPSNYNKHNTLHIQKHNQENSIRQITTYRHIKNTRIEIV